MYEKLIQGVRDVHKIQGLDGNWNYDPYMMGLYNGLEMALSILESRIADFKSKPEKWIADQPCEYVLCDENGEVERGSD